MRSARLSPKQYRDFASQCLRWAAKAKHEEHKKIMLQMADHWMQRAQDLERRGEGHLRRDEARNRKPPPGIC
jgi:hypothetical protein